MDSLNGVVQRIIGDSRGRRGEEELDEVEVGALEEDSTNADHSHRFKRVYCSSPELLDFYIRRRNWCI